MKVCRKCKEEKPLTEFYANKRCSDGKQYYCKVCSKAKQAAWRASNPEKERAKQAAWRASNPEKAMAGSKSVHKASMEAVSDCYIANRLMLPVATIPQELINLKREQIKMYRATKQLTKTLKEIQDAT